ncbi:MAG: hypothetical protein AAGF75_13665, partial [Cyanobacteria bacterium P01_H01_bin.130]
RRWHWWAGTNPKGAVAIAQSAPNTTPKKTTTRRKRSPAKSATAKPVEKNTPPPPEASEEKLPQEKHPPTRRKLCVVCGAPLSSAIAPGKLVCPHGHPQPTDEEET